MNKIIKMNKQVVVVIGAGGIGQAIARRQCFGKVLLLADFNTEALERTASGLRDAGYIVETQSVDIASRESVEALAVKAVSLGDVVQVVNAAGVSPNMASVERILAVDLYGAALVLDVFEGVIAQGGAGLLVSSMAGHMLPPLSSQQDQDLAFTSVDELLGLPMLGAEFVPNSAAAYGLAKRANALRVRAAAVSWGAKGARVNAISPGIIVTPLAQHELNSSVGDIYRKMVSSSPSGRMAPPDEVAAAAAYLLGSEANFVTGTDLLIDGGVVAAIFAGKIALQM
ncbi:SDR family oxidoreductase [Neokomagataea anthophila]|uniref:SDR family oxidoreductase n=1 Tax=Neokomagataea anthophila TaxID=2826925 RepID=A0ABS5E9A4_9PROT|nr:SDR family oxidoreductase [Neokomagataea anthophila]MBR0560449.1 SDR family oxidoreductase [Neokomagataea anthophila]